MGIKLKKAGLIFLILGLSLVYQNCSKQNFSSPASDILPTTTGTPPVVPPNAPTCVSTFILKAGMALYSGSALDLSVNSTIMGEAILLGSNSISLNNGSEISGDVFINTNDTGLHSVLNGGKAPSITTTNLNGVQDGLIAVNAKAVALVPTSSYPSGIIASGSVNSTLTSVGALNVINVQGDVTINNGSNLILNGGPNDLFIINVSGNFTVDGQANMILQGGVVPKHVLLTVGRDLFLNQGSVAVGTFLVTAGISINGNSTLTGALVSAGNVVLNTDANLALSPAVYCP